MIMPNCAGQVDLDDATKEHLEVAEGAGVENIIMDNCAGFLVICEEISQECKDFTFYYSLIEGLVTLVYLLYSKDDLYGRGCSSMLFDQLNNLWEEFADFAMKGKTVYEVCELVARTQIDRKKYSLVRECDVSRMISLYRAKHRYLSAFKQPYQHYCCNDVKRRSTIYNDIKAAFVKLKVNGRLPVDQYTHLLVEMYRDEDVKFQEMLLARAVNKIDTEALYRLDSSLLLSHYLSTESGHCEDLDFRVADLLMQFVWEKKLLVKDQMAEAFSPILNMCFSEKFDLPICCEIQGSIEVAELRRTAEGHRFISRNDVLWAFSEGVYELPTLLRFLARMEMAADDHPPYHIYRFSLEIAKAFGAKVVQLEHFAFSVVFGSFLGYSVEKVLESRVLRALYTSVMNSIHYVKLGKDCSKTPAKSHFMLSCLDGKRRTMDDFKEQHNTILDMVSNYQYLKPLNTPIVKVLVL